MSQPIDSQQSDPRSSSFPISSPSFWNEAIQAPIPVPPRRRSLDASADTASSPPSSSPPLPPTKRTRQSPPTTTLSYLPKRDELLSLDPLNPHSYLSNPEYAPNKFGDIGDYMRKKEIKVQTQNRDIALASASSGIPQIFAGLSFYINGNTRPPMEELRKMILQRGGEVRPVLRSKGMVKFIIAPMLTLSKFKEFARYKVVREGWILESCKEGKLLDWTRWKLQVQGGWEEEGRKGMEGFFKGSTQIGDDDKDVKEDVKPDNFAVDTPKNVLTDFAPIVNSGRSAALTSKLEKAVSSQPPPSTPINQFTGPTSQDVFGPVTPVIPVSSQRSNRDSRLVTATLAGTPTTPTSTPIRLASAATGSLLRPTRPPPKLNYSPKTESPLVPQAEGKMTPKLPLPVDTDNVKPQAPAASTTTEGSGALGDAAIHDVVQEKVGRYEGLWEFYHSKESNEDAARLLKDKEWRLKNTAERGNEGGFIDGYYQNSRLHHLSTWKAELRVLVAAAQHQSEEQSLKVPSSTNTAISSLSLATSVLPRTAQLSTGAGNRIIFHVDFDCFFVSCGLATRPHLKGKPAVVCHSQAGRMAGSTSEIASASYEARAKGVKNGMSLGRARTLVGESLQTIPYEFETYKKFSLAFYTVLMGYADELQAVSVDEALIDVTSAVNARAIAPEEARDGIGEQDNLDRDPAIELAEMIRNDVRGLTEGCEVSIGISHNILLAKLATRRAKPAGVFHLLPNAIPEFLAPLDVEDLPSIGYSIRTRIEEKFNSTKCGELLEYPKGAFRGLLGPKTGDMVWGYLRGVDERKLEPHKERKSVSAEMNYGIRFQNQEQAEILVKDLAAEVAKRMKAVNAKGKLITLKLMSRHPEAPLEPPKFLGHGWCETFNKSAPIGNRGGGATDDADVFAMECIKLLRVVKLDPAELRGVGIQITKLDGDKALEREAGQGTLSFGKGKARDRSESVKLDDEEEEAAEVPEVTELDEEGDDIRVPRVSSTTLTLPVSGIEEPEPSVVPLSRPPPLQTRQQVSLRDNQAGPSNPPPSSDGIDPDFLAALPPELRREVKQDYARTRSRAASEAVIIPVPLPLNIPKVPERAVTISPAKHKTLNSAAHITRQLRPKNKTQLRAGVIADLPLYGAWAKAKDRATSIDISLEEDETVIGIYRASEIKELGIDLEVFAELPEEMRNEIVDEERRKTRQRKMLHRPADTSRVRARERQRGFGNRTASLSPTRSSRAGSIPPALPRLSITRPARPMLLKSTTLPDVLQTVTRWIESRGDAAPAAKDAGKVKGYLIKCVEEPAGLGGVDAAVEVMRWMKVILSERWDEDGVEVREEGREWWRVWRDFKEGLDGVCWKRFGAGLRL